MNALTGENISAWMRDQEPVMDGVLALALFACCVWFGLAARPPAGY